MKRVEPGTRPERRTLAERRGHSGKGKRENQKILKPCPVHRRKSEWERCTELLVDPVRSREPEKEREARTISALLSKSAKGGISNNVSQIPAVIRRAGFCECGALKKFDKNGGVRPLNAA